jgi:nitroimidazol reductase NimA-like FMN-containing flavoprotein (pyridoxamine 5'-phosphate oxidase superfamily)
VTTDRTELALRLLASNRYMTLGTADEHGRPWTSPVWFAAPSPAELLWVSAPETRHSRNIASRPAISIVVFDSTVPEGTGQAVYMEATAAEVADAELGGAIEMFSTASLVGGAEAWSLADVRAPARHRLYRARVSQHWVLGPRDERIAVEP